MIRATTTRKARYTRGRRKVREVGDVCGIVREGKACAGIWAIKTYRRMWNAEIAVRVLECGECHARAFRKIQVAEQIPQPRLAIVPASGVPTAHICER